MGVVALIERTFRIEDLAIKGDMPIAGVVQKSSTATMVMNTPVDYSKGKWKYIRIYSGVEAGTVGEIDSTAITATTITVTKVWKTSSMIINGTPLEGDIYRWTEEDAPQITNWRPQKGDKFVLCESTKFWLGDNGHEMPAIITVKEVVEDTDFKDINTNLVNNKLNEIEKGLTKISPAIKFVKVPNLFFGKIVSGVIENRSSFAFNPGPTNLQLLKGELYVPRQFGPYLNNVDLFEAKIILNLGVSVNFVDCWDS